MPRKPTGKPIGRPPKAEVARGIVVSLRLTQAERERLDRLRDGEEDGDYLRALLAAEHDRRFGGTT